MLGSVHASNLPPPPATLPLSLTPLYITLSRAESILIGGHPVPPTSTSQNQYKSLPFLFAHTNVLQPKHSISVFFEILQYRKSVKKLTRGQLWSDCIVGNMNGI